MNKEKVFEFFKKEGTQKVIKAAIPVILFLLFSLITFFLNTSVSIYKSGYIGSDETITFSSDIYRTSDDVGLYRFDDETMSVILYSEETGNEIHLARPTVFALEDSDGNFYISAAAIALQSFAALCYIGGCVYMCIVYKTN